LRGSRPVLGGAEGEIPSAYSPLEDQGVFQLLKELTCRRILAFYNSYSDIENLISTIISMGDANTLSRDFP